jgi:hypothetical protein
VSLTSDINTKLDQIASLISAVVTPEDKIKAYRQSMVLKNSVDDDLAALKSLVGQSSAQGNLLGFVGGSQTISVWGIIIIVIAGFVFLTIYMKKLMSKTGREVKEIKEELAPGVLVPEPAQKQIQAAPSNPAAGFIVVMLITGLLSAGSAAYVVNNIVTKNYEQKMAVLGTETIAPAATSAPVESFGTGTGGQYLVVVSDTASGFVSVMNTPDGTELVKVKPGDKLPFLDEQNGWYKVTLENGSIGWISKDNSTKE